jgi:hypothetical protein
VSALNNQTTNQMRADKAGAARDQYVHASSRFFALVLTTRS